MMVIHPNWYIYYFEKYNFHYLLNYTQLFQIILIYFQSWLLVILLPVLVAGAFFGWKYFKKNKAMFIKTPVPVVRQQIFYDIK